MNVRFYKQIILSLTVLFSVSQVAIAAPGDDAVGGDSSGSRVSADSRQARQAFQALDQEAESVLKEVLNLSSDLAVISERENNPPKNQLVVMVTLDPTNLFELSFLELRVDNQVVAAHHYTDIDLLALSRGGGHRMYLTNLPADTHELQARMLGRIPRDPDYQREAEFSFVSGVSRTVIELSITNAKTKGFPSLVVREWN